MNLKIILLFCFTLIIHFVPCAKEMPESNNLNDINIVEYGAKPDGKTDNTQIIQKAIDQCSLSGGGTIFFPAGTYMSGSIFIKTNVTINLHKLAILNGIATESAYPKLGTVRQAFIHVYQASGVSIIGEGTIEGNGGNQVFQKGNNGKNRPFLVFCYKSKNVVIKDVRLRNAAFWTLRLFESDNIRIDGIDIYSHNNWNNDGIDIDSKNVIISNCNIDCDDDALCFKSDSKVPCENVVVTNCILASNCNLIKFGTAGIGGFKNIAVSNCVLRPASESKFRFWNQRVPGVTDSLVGVSGIALEVVDGGAMDQVTISNISMKGIMTPIFIRLGSRKNPTGSLKNVLISNVVATARSPIASSITGVPGFYVENVVIRDVIINCHGGGTLEDVSRVVPERENSYPESKIFGNLPAYGIYVRHAKNIYLDNVQFNLMKPDQRSALWFDDAHEVTVRALKAPLPINGQKLIIEEQSAVKVIE